MEHVTAKVNTFQSSHPSDRGSSITVIDSHTMVLEDGKNTASLSFEDEDSKDILLHYLHYHLPKESIGIKLEMRLRNDNWLVVEYDNRDEPYVKGILISVGAHPIGNGVTVSVFLEARDVPVFTKALVNGNRV